MGKKKGILLKRSLITILSDTGSSPESIPRRITPCMTEGSGDVLKVRGLNRHTCKTC